MGEVGDRWLYPILHLFGDRFFEGLAVDAAGKMDRAFAVDGIPVGGVRAAEKLGLKAHADDGRFRLKADDPPGGLPRRRTGRATDHLDLRNFAIL